MAGEAEDNIVIETPHQDGGLGNQPNPAPKEEPTGKPVEQKTPEQIAEDAKAAEAAEAAKKAEEAAAAEDNGDEDEEQPEWDKQYLQFSDPAAQSVVNLLNESGVSAVEANSIFEKALQSDSLDDIKWDVLEARLGKDKAALAKIGITDYFNREYSKNVATTKTAHEVMGGEGNWKKVASWVKKAEKANPSRKAEFDEIRKGLDMGGRYGKQAATDLRALYEADNGNSGLGASKVQQGNQKPKSDEPPMTRAEYTAELRKHGDAINPALYAKLRQRRQAGMAAGI